MSIHTMLGSSLYALEVLDENKGRLVSFGIEWCQEVFFDGIKFT